MNEGSIISVIAQGKEFYSNRKEYLCAVQQTEKSILEHVSCNNIYSSVAKSYSDKHIYLAERIEYHEPRGEGDQHYCDVFFEDGKVRRVFRPESITCDRASESLAECILRKRREISK